LTKPTKPQRLTTMKIPQITLDPQKISRPFRITSPTGFSLQNYSPHNTLHLKSKDKEIATGALKEGIIQLASLQDKLYAQDQWGLLLIFQAPDAAGKDGAIKHVMSGVNPQGCQVHSFKAPSAQDLDHDYLWRTSKCLPERGRIGIFNRSYYEETLAVRVHPELLKTQKIPECMVTDTLWQERFEDISAFEKYLHRNGIIVRKFFLNISPEEQKKRLLKRIEDPKKNWKFSAGDLQTQQKWAEYQKAYEETIRNTSTPDSPWYIVPADKKWFARLVIAAAIIDALESLNLKYPPLKTKQEKRLKLSKKKLKTT